MKYSIILLALLAVTTSCKKIEGPGGTSAIRGQLTGQDFSFGEKEITTISFTTGATLEHGSYTIFITQIPIGFLLQILNFKGE